MNELARWISILAHPFITSLVVVLAVALRRSSPREALRIMIFVAVIAILPVAVLIYGQVRRGAWTNVDASNRNERSLLYVGGVAALLGLLVVVLTFEPRSFLVRGALGVGTMLAVCAVLTRWIKVSLHMAFGGFATATLLSLGSPAGWGLLVVLPALGWSRLALKRHTPVEVALGLLVGIALGYATSNL